MKKIGILSLLRRRPPISALFNKFVKSLAIAFLITSSAFSAAASGQAESKNTRQLVAVSFVSNASGANILSSPDGITWTRQFSGTTNALYAVTSNRAGRYVAVGNVGTVTTSTDGINWTPRSSGISNYLRGVAADNTGTFVAVGSYGTVVSSADGLNWTTRRQGFSPVTLFGVTASRTGLFVAVGVGGLIVSSQNGISWTNQFAPTTYDLNEVAVNDAGLFVAVGTTNGYSGNGFTLTSSDGINWAYKPLNVKPLYSIAVNSHGLFVAGGVGGEIITSPDGVNWTQQTSGTTQYLQSITLNGKGSGNEQFFASCSSGAVLSSSDGINWAVQSTGTTDNLTGITSFD